MPQISPAELRVLCRLAWNNWPDSADSRRGIAAHEARDPISATAWDRVVGVILGAVLSPDARHVIEGWDRMKEARFAAETELVPVAQPDRAAVS